MQRPPPQAYERPSGDGVEVTSFTADAQRTPAEHVTVPASVEAMHRLPTLDGPALTWNPPAVID